MKYCPFCQAQNQEEATVCYHCGRAFLPNNPPADPTPTQPVRIRPAQTGPVRSTTPTQPAAAQRSMGQKALDPVNLYGQPGNAFPQRAPYFPPPDPTPAYTQPYNQPPYIDGAEYQQQPYAQPAYSPASTDLPAKARRDAWPLVIAGLGLFLILACGLAFFTITRANTNGVVGLGAQVSTRVGEVFAGRVSDTPAPTAPPQPTAAPALATLAATQTPEATQESIANRLLSPECKGSLDQLSNVSDQVKSNPLKVLDKPWRRDLDQATTDMKTYCGSLDSASPIPGEIGQVQKSIQQANSQFDQAKQLWNQAIDQRDPSKAIDAAQRVGEATQYLGQALSQLQQITR